MASRLTDDELRQSLRDMGEDVGPITPTTRSTLERRLGALRRARGHPNALSSDDSEVEGAPSPPGAQPRRKRVVPPRRAESEIFKRPAAVNVPVARTPPHRTLNRKQPKKTRNSTFEVETSDSEFESPLLRRPLASLHPPDNAAAGGLFRRGGHNHASPPTSTPHNSHQFTPTLDRLKKGKSRPHAHI